MQNSSITTGSMSCVRKRYMFQARATKMPLQRAALISISILIENSNLFPIITSLADNWSQNYTLAHN